MAKNGRVYTIRDERRYGGCLIAHDGHVRTSWDCFVLLLLLYLIIMVPMGLAFGEAVANSFDHIIDYFFLIDVLLNFRTTYVNSAGKRIASCKQIALHYMRGWFLLDILSSLPLDQLSGSLLPDLQPARLLKAGKITKVLKMLKFAKIKDLLSGEHFEVVQDAIFVHQWAFKIFFMLATTTCLGHLLSCFLIVSGTGWLAEYQEVSLAVSSEYIAALYWALTTMSTVGFGDIIPHSDAERVYAMIAMAIGVTFFGYMVGTITSVITAKNLNARAYEERMDLIQSWLDFHGEIPQLLRRRVRRHLKEQFTSKAAVADSVIMDDLSTELRTDLSYFLMNDEVRCNPLFHNLGNGALEHLVSVISKTSAAAGDRIVGKGQVGLAMYVLTAGVAHYEEGHQWSSLSSLTTALGVGDSFGEEIILNMEETYQYTVIADTHVDTNVIYEDRFVRHFENMPDIVAQMRRNFFKNDHPEKMPPSKNDAGRSSSATPNIDMPPNFPEAVLESLQTLLVLNGFQKRNDGHGSD